MWKLLVLASMGVDVPVDAVQSILRFQTDWEKNCMTRTTAEKLHKVGINPHVFCKKICYRNEQKKAKRARHEREKDYLEALQKLGSTVGEYVGDGQGEESASVEQALAVDLDNVNDSGVVDADWEVDDLSMEQTEGNSDDSHPLLFSYDCETTGLSIYNDHIIEIAAEVIDCPVVSHSNANFSSLVKTSRRIPSAGKNYQR